MKFKKSVWVLPLLIILASCGPGFKTLHNYISSSSFRRIAVMPFAAATDYSNLGQEAADLMSQHLEDYGFILVSQTDRDKILAEQKLSQTGAINPQQAIAIGHVLGVQAVLTGSVGEASEQKVRRPPLVQNNVVTSVDQSGNVRSHEEREVLRPAETVFVEVYSATARLTDVETGQLLWVGSSSSRYENSTVQEVASEVMEDLSYQLAVRFYKSRL